MSGRTKQRLWCLVLAILLLVSGNADAQGGMRVENVTWVAATADPAANCQALRDVLAALPPPLDPPFLFSGQLVHLERGDYDCADTTLIVPRHVSLEGTGETTQIKSIAHPAVRMTPPSSLTNLVVRHQDSGTAIRVAAPNPFFVGQASLVGVTAVVDSFVGCPLDAIGVPVTVDGGSFLGGPIEAAVGADLTLSRVTLESVVTDGTVTTRCYFYEGPTGLATGPACP